MSKVMVSLPSDLLVEIDAEVRRRGTTRSGLIAEAARRELARRSQPVVLEALERSRQRFASSGAFESGDLIRAERDARK